MIEPIFTAQFSEGNFVAPLSQIWGERPTSNLGRRYVNHWRSQCTIYGRFKICCFVLKPDHLETDLVENRGKISHFLTSL